MNRLPLLRTSLLAPVVALMAVLALTTPAQATHIFFTDVTVNGVPLDPNPLAPITASPSGDVTFFARAFGSSSTLNFTFNQLLGTNSSPLASQSFFIPSSPFPAGNAPYPAGTPNEFTWVQNFNGSFTGTLRGDIPPSSPDYIAPGQNRSTARQDGHTFAFSVQLDPAAPAAVVPEPSTLALCGIGAIGAAIRAMRQRRQQTV